MPLIEDIFKLYYAPLCNYASKLVYDSGKAEDIVQELFIHLWETGALKKIQKPEPFLLRSVKYRCIDFVRKQRGHYSMPIEQMPAQEMPEQSALTEDDIEPLLYYFAAKLPPKTREVFLLSRRAGLTYAQIADELQISVKTVEAHQSKALKTMKILLAQHDFYSVLLAAGVAKLIFDRV